eukprot:TRINITY_DN9776_c0_g1_i2.p2 TRINITY_DN9776_c0_g1~~TRINITY_DN9776_c0_g1_i2.p2  ORF type:complete len:253 (+),score=70.23 TRINITY_DN9776_c0_g1_i2:93-761(+)
MLRSLVGSEMCIRDRTTHIQEWDCQLNDKKFVQHTARVRSQGRYDLRGEDFLAGLGLPRKAAGIDFVAIGEVLEQVELYDAPLEKLGVLYRVRDEMMARASVAGMTHLGADEMVPLLLVSLIWSPMANPATDVQVIQDGLQEEVSHGEGAYVFACFAAAVAYIVEELNPADFEPPPSDVEEEFPKEVAASKRDCTSCPGNVICKEDIVEVDPELNKKGAYCC